MKLDRVGRQALGPILAGYLAAGDGTDHAVDIADRQGGPHLCAAIDGRLAEIEQRRDIQALFEAMFLSHLAILAHASRYLGLVEDAREIQTQGLVMFERLGHLQQFTMADHVVESAETKL